VSSAIVEPKRGINVDRVLVEVRVHNVDDLRRCERGEIPEDRVRSASIQASVDSGATFFCLPEDVVQQLGLPFNRERDTRSVTGSMKMRIHGGARIDVQGRACDVEIMALPVGTQALLGQIPLETLDFWIDVVNHRLVGNPEHGGQWMAEVY